MKIKMRYEWKKISVVKSKIEREKSEFGCELIYTLIWSWDYEEEDRIECFVFFLQVFWNENDHENHENTNQNKMWNIKNGHNNVGFYFYFCNVCDAISDCHCSTV